jgi:putative ABC transport system permease protein
VLTALSITIAFVLLGLLEGVNAGFAQAIADAHREFLVTRTRVRGGAPMPISAMDKIRSIPGVKEVGQRAYFMGSVREPAAKNTLAAIATDPEVFFDVLPALVASKQAVEALRANRAGMLATPALLTYFGWHVGDTVSARSQTPNITGSRDWTFTIVGTFATPKAPDAAFAVINYAYFDGYRAEDRGTAETFYVRIADPTRAVATAAAIDRIFLNSPHETRTQSQQESAESRAKQMGDIGFFTRAIMGAVVFTLAFLTGNTLRQSLHERIPEFAVLKTVGYTDARVLRLAFAEALALYMPAAALGLLLAYVVAPLARQDIGTIIVSPEVATAGLLGAALLALTGTALPALKLSRLPIAASLGKR